MDELKAFKPVFSTFNNNLLFYPTQPWKWSLYFVTHIKKIRLVLNQVPCCLSDYGSPKSLIALPDNSRVFKVLLFFRFFFTVLLSVLAALSPLVIYFGATVLI